MVVCVTACACVEETPPTHYVRGCTCAGAQVWGAAVRKTCQVIHSLVPRPFTKAAPYAWAPDKRARAKIVAVEIRPRESRREEENRRRENDRPEIYPSPRLQGEV